MRSYGIEALLQPEARRQIGAHYTSERDILKVIRSLFLDELRAELETRKAARSIGRRARLEGFHDRLCHLRFLDPACGCGNFLVIAYRELRQLELETLRELFGKQTEMTLDEITKLSQVDVDQFYGIEILEWPARIAEVALCLMDRQMIIYFRRSKVSCRICQSFLPATFCCAAAIRPASSWFLVGRSDL
jgi:type I restriction-modification system DNA methylase subunit